MNRYIWRQAVHTPTNEGAEIRKQISRAMAREHVKWNEMLQDLVHFRYLALEMEKHLLLLPDGVMKLSPSYYIASSTL
jgi:hypothetical protein